MNNITQKNSRKKRTRISSTTKEAIILLLEQSKMSCKEIAKLYGVAYQSVKNMSADYNNIKKGKLNILRERGNLHIYAQVKKDLQEKFTKHCDRVLESITGEDYKRASLSQKAIASGIFIEKSLLLAGEPTEITSQVDKMSTKDLLKEFRKQVVGDSKDTEIILEQDGIFSKVKHIEVKE